MEDVVYFRKGTFQIYCIVGGYAYVRRIDREKWKISAFTADEIRQMIDSGLMTPITPPE